MTLGDVFGIAFLLAGLAVVLPALGLLARALAPAAVDRARRGVLYRPGASLGRGIPAAGLLVVLPLVAVGNPAPALKILGLAVLAGGVALAIVGLAGAAEAVGGRLPSPADEGRPWRPLARGGVCLVLASLVPVVGWFAVAPLVLALGMGAVATGGEPDAEPAPEPA